jgi:hypothetical protein
MEADIKRMFSEANGIRRVIDFKKRKIQAIKNKGFLNSLVKFNVVRRAKREIQALEEGQRDILIPSVTNTSSNVRSEAVDINNYPTYPNQVGAAYDFYDNKKEYGGDLTKGLVETRVAMIAGEGLSVNSPNEAKAKWIEDFLLVNKLHGSRLMKWITTGELEGKNLILLKPGIDAVTGDKVIKARSWEWNYYNYTVEVDAFDRDEIKAIKYKEKSDFAKEKTVNPKTATYVKLAGADQDVNITSNRLHAILTDIENYSRAKYDLRKNTHLFGRVSPYFNTEDGASAKSINADLQANEWPIGTAYAGPAKFSYVEPTGAGSQSILMDMLTSLRVISMMLGIPIHFLAHPELMSNRATADTLHEVVINSTRKDRLIWDESFKEIIQKALVMAVDAGIADNSILKGDFQVRLPIISISLLKQIIEIWYPLLQDDVISQFTFSNMLPGINPVEEKELLKKEKEERIKENPLNNGVRNPLIKPNEELEENERIQEKIKEIDDER